MTAPTTRTPQQLLSARVAVIQGCDPVWEFRRHWSEADQEWLEGDGPWCECPFPLEETHDTNYGLIDWFRPSASWELLAQMVEGSRKGNIVADRALMAALRVSPGLSDIEKLGECVVRSWLGWKDDPEVGS